MSEKTPYDPTFPMFREMLGLSILGKLEESGFTLEPPTSHAAEKVYSRVVDGTDNRVKIKVFTSVVGTEARNVGYDAIKVAAIYETKAGKTRGLTKDRRVNRTGNMEDIVERMLERMRDAWKDGEDRQAMCQLWCPMLHIHRRQQGLCGNLLEN